MKSAKWIWIKSEYEKDDYAEFICNFTCDATKKTYIKVSCDSACVVFLNDTPVFFGQCSDYPFYKFYDRVDVSKYCKRDNTLKISVWHFGEDTQNYVKADAGLIFEVESDGKVVASSDKNVRARQMNEYLNGYSKKITGQLGFSFLYDAEKVSEEYNTAVEVVNKALPVIRPIKRLELLSPVKTVVKEQNGAYLIDLLEEYSGFLKIDVESSVAQKLTVAYGEHLENGCVPQTIGDRDFSVEILLKRGRARYVNYFRRLACRYIQVKCDAPLKINYVGLVPVVYPVTERKITFSDKEADSIYRACVKTLKLCMHEHYEDTPWREQCLYALDARNQMSAGYVAFKGTDYPRYNLLLLGKSLLDSGLVNICAPSGAVLPIPFFSIAYLMALGEYVNVTKDKKILDSLSFSVNEIIRAFSSNIDDNGLIANFSKPCWNFYEWSYGNDNFEEVTCGRNKEDKKYDLILNASFVYVIEKFSKTLGINFDTSAVKKRIIDVFYDNENGVFINSDCDQNSSVLGNAFAILCGSAPDDKVLAQKLINDKTLTPCTLSMLPFYYDALLKADEGYADFIVSDIKNRYRKMSGHGSCVWETEKGYADFGGAGSLCHGWSALAVKYLFDFCKHD